MSHKLDSHYNDFGGLDSRSNKLMQNPKTARAGKNFQYNYQDELCKANGFQHKLPTSGCEAALMEYKYRDINTGESLFQWLGIGSDGNLNRALKHRLKLTKAGGSVDNYSLFYDDTGTPTWKIVFYDSSGASLGSFDFTTATTLLELETGITALALAGLTADIVDADGASVASTTCLAYCLDTVIEQEIETGDNYNDAYYWEQVPVPTSEVPFPNVVSQASNPGYEGPTWVNLNNALYITDGGFPMRYDGFAVYRAGMPRLDISNGLSGAYSHGAAGGLTTGTNYRYAKQICFVDPNGVEICGKVEPDGKLLALGSNTAARIEVPPVYENFPVFSCHVDGDQTITGTGSKVLTVLSGHNCKVGQCLRVPIMNSSNATTTQKGFSWAYYEITDTTATTITFNKTESTHYMPVYTSTVPISTYTLSNGAGAGQDGLFKSGLIINAAYVPDSWKGKVTDPRNLYSDGVAATETQFAWAPGPIYGAFCRLLRSDSDGETLYRLADVPIPHKDTTTYVGTISFGGFGILDLLPDDDLVGGYEGGLTAIPLSENSGEELPRACRYLSKWQDQLVQSGRPYDVTQYIGTAYPVLDWEIDFSNKWTPGFVNPPWYYSEADMCDFSSIYWASPEASEGFPRDGLHEFLIDSKTFNDEIRGMAPDKDSFFVMKDRSLGYLTGSLATNNISLEMMESDAAGCCHKAIQEVNGSLVFMDDKKGFWAVSAGKTPQFLGFPIQNYFKNNTRGLNFRKAVAANFRAQDKYICFIPGDNSIYFVFDYAETAKGIRACWYPWEGVDASGGILATSDDQLLISSGTSDILWKQKFTGTKYDFSNHISAIDFQYVTAWINFGAPMIAKHFSKVWLNSIQGGFNLTVTQYGNYLDYSLGDYSFAFLAESEDKKNVKEYVNINVDRLVALSLMFSNSDLYGDVRIQGWELEYSPTNDVNEGRP